MTRTRFVVLVAFVFGVAISACDRELRFVREPSDDDGQDASVDAAE